MLTVGEPAPDFHAKSHAGDLVSLASLKGKNVLLWFYPKADTPGCTAEASSVPRASTAAPDSPCACAASDETLLRDCGQVGGHMQARWWIAVGMFVAGCSGGPSGLTVEQLEAAKELAHPMQPLDDARPKLVEALGEPMKLDDAGMHWYAPSGDGCKDLAVGMMGTSVGSVEIKDGPCP